MAQNFTSSRKTELATDDVPIEQGEASNFFSTFDDFDEMQSYLKRYENNYKKLNLVDENGDNALHYVFLYHKYWTLETLLHSQINRKKHNNYGFTPLDYALLTSEEHNEVVAYILQFLARPDSFNVEFDVDFEKRVFSMQCHESPDECTRFRKDVKAHISKMKLIDSVS